MIPALPHDITHWQRLGTDGFGKPAFAAPAVIKGRWAEKLEEFVDEKGEDNISQAVVILGIDVSNGDYLYLGSSEEANPLNVAGAYPIKRFSKVPDLRAVEYVRRAWL